MGVEKDRGCPQAKAVRGRPRKSASKAPVAGNAPPTEPMAPPKPAEGAPQPEPAAAEVEEGKPTGRDTHGIPGAAAPPSDDGAGPEVEGGVDEAGEPGGVPGGGPAAGSGKGGHELAAKDATKPEQRDAERAERRGVRDGHGRRGRARVVKKVYYFNRPGRARQPAHNDPGPESDTGTDESESSDGYTSSSSEEYARPAKRRRRRPPARPRIAPRSRDGRFMRRPPPPPDSSSDSGDESEPEAPGGGFRFTFL